MVELYVAKLGAVVAFFILYVYILVSLDRNGEAGLVGLKHGGVSEGEAD